MGNATGRMEAGLDDGGVGDDRVDDSVKSNGDIAPGENRAPVRYGAGRVIPAEVFPVQFRSPMLISPQIPIAPSQKNDDSVSFSQTRQSDSQGPVDPKQGIPIIITWNYGGSDVLVEGSWDNWTSKKRMQRSGKDCSILLVLPAGIYHYKFIVDGEYRYVPELPHISDDSSRICNLLDVHITGELELVLTGVVALVLADELLKGLGARFSCCLDKRSLNDRLLRLGCVPEYPESIAEFEAPPSPESSYSQVPSGEEDFAKEPLVVPPQLHLTVLGPANAEEPVPSRPQHVMLNHLFLEKGRSSQSAVALGLTHRFKSKYVTVVLYKPVKR